MQKQTTKSKALLAAGAFALVLVAAAAMTFLSGNALSAKVSRSDQNTSGSSITTNKKTPAICRTYAAPPPDWCANGTIVPQPKDANGCAVPAKCIEATTACNACVGGIATDEKDSSGCPVYICPTTATTPTTGAATIPAEELGTGTGGGMVTAPTTTAKDRDDKKDKNETSRVKKPVNRFFDWSCEDSDGGINAEQKGTVTAVLTIAGMKFPRQYTDYTDSKQGKYFIKEYYCDDKNQARSKNIKCKNGAVDGACQAEGNEDSVITVSVTGDTPPSDILVAGTNEANLVNFKITSTKDIVINKLQITNSGNDENIVNLILINSESTKTGFLTNHVAEFGGLNFKIPANTTRLFSIEAELNTIADGAKSGGKIKIGLSANGFEAIEQSTGTKITNPGFTGTLWGNEMTVYETKPTVTLASSSPSGSRTTSMTDEVFVFNVAAESTENVRLNQIKISLGSDASLNSVGNDSEHTAYLKEGGSTVATGTVQIQDASHGSVTFTFPATNPVEITKGTSKTFTLQLNTANLISSEAGKDDLLTPSILLGNSSIEGGFWWSDTNTDNIKWTGHRENSDPALYGYTLKY